MDKKHFSAYLVSYELTGFLGIIIFLWVDEIFDLPYNFFGAPPTPVNITESLFESILVLIAGTVTIIMTKKILHRIKILEGLIPICASCKKIKKSNGDWIQIEKYIKDNSSANFTHGICPDCVKKLYPDLDLNKKNN